MMKTIILSALGSLLLLGGGIGYAVQASSDTPDTTNTPVITETNGQQNVQSINEDKDAFLEYEVLDEIIDDDDNYHAEVVENNQHKRIILLKDNNDQPRFKSIYVKDANRLKVIDLEGGQIFNQVLNNVNDDDFDDVDFDDDDDYDNDFDEFDDDDKDDHHKQAKHQVSNDMKTKMDTLAFAEFELSVEYGDDEEYEASLEQKRFGGIEAELEDELHGVHMHGQEAFDNIYPAVEKLNIDRSTNQKDAIKQVLKTFSLDSNYKEIEIEIEFKDDHTKIELEDNQF